MESDKTVEVIVVLPVFGVFSCFGCASVFQVLGLVVSFCLLFFGG